MKDWGVKTKSFSSGGCGEIKGTKTTIKRISLNQTNIHAAEEL